LGAVDRHRCEIWNQTVVQIQGVLDPIIDKGLASLEPTLAKKLRGCCRFDLLGACMEHEHSDVIAPALHTELGGWYLQGRFPCGWNGEYPQGRLIVY
jgi:hypothetical protein